MISLPLIAGRIFGEPLAIEPGKLDVIVNAIGPRLRGMPMDDSGSDDDAPDAYSESDGIATIDICGTLVCKTGGMQALSGLTSYADIGANFSKAISDPSILGIVLCIDSPGGEVSGMLELADMMYSARGTKPVCAVVNCAASAAYMLASTADQIIVSRTGLVGSIGVIALHLDQSVADEKAGLTYTAVYAGARKNDGTPHAPLSPEAKGNMQSRIDQVYGMFTSAVARNRGMKESAIVGTQAAVYMGQASADIGLADSVGTIDDAAAMLRAAIAGGSKSLYAKTSVASATNTKEKQMETQNAADATKIAEANAAALVAAKLEGYADAAAIVDLCLVAGVPAQAGKFIAEKKSAAEVMKSLIDAKAASQDATAINSAAMPADAVQGADKKATGKARPWSEVMAAIGGKKEKK